MYVSSNIFFKESYVSPYGTREIRAEWAIETARLSYRGASRILDFEKKNLRHLPPLSIYVAYGETQT